MINSKMSSSSINITLLLSFIIFLLFALGVHHLLVSHQENECEMTFMFQYPQFVEIALPPDIQVQFSRYTLYGYGEGGIIEDLRKKKFKGVPVLFIPGSSGSHRQGRSIASVSLRKSLNSRTPFHFNYFMTDFNEEHTSVYGGVLEDQTKFVAHCIRKILTLYQTNDQPHKPQTVILIGHSFGGLIAKGVFTVPDFDPKTIHLIITLSTPHKYPLFQCDTFIRHYYKSIADHWRNNSQLQHITSVSIGGGPRDLLIHSDVTLDPNADINVLTTAVPGVWISNDHLSIVWCKQLILTLVRALFDSVDLSTRQLSTDKSMVNSVFHYHLLKRGAGKKFSGSHITRFSTFERNVKWMENLQRQFTINEPHGLKANQYIMIRLFSDPKREAAFIETYNLNVKDWLYVCNADLVYRSVRMCERGENLSNLTEIAPVDKTFNLKRKFVYLNLYELKAKSFTHILVRMPASYTPMTVNVDVHQPSERNILLNVPKFYSLSTNVVISSTETNSGFYSIHLVGFEYLWQSFSLQVDTLSCKAAKNNAVVSFITPWANEDQHFIFRDKKQLCVTLNLISARPKNHDSNSHPFVRFHLDPTCKYKMSVKFSVTGMFAQGVRYYFLLLPSFLAAVGILALRQQMKHLDDGKCVLFHIALSSAIRRYHIILQITILGSKILGIGVFLAILPVPDFSILQEINLDSFFLTILLYAVAVVTIYIMGTAVYVAVIISGQAAHNMALRFIAKTISGAFNWSEWIISGLHQIPMLVSCILVSLSFSVSGAVSIYLGTFFYFLKLCKMYEEYLEDWFHFSLILIAKKIKNLMMRTFRKKNKNSKKHEETHTNEQKETENEVSEKQKKGDNEKGDTDKESENTETLVASKFLQQSRKECDLLSAIHFHVSVFVIWVSLCLLYIPSILMWSKNYNFSIYLEKDPALIPSILVSICGAILWQSDTPKPCKELTKIASFSLFLIAALSIIYATFSVYRLGFLISASLCIVSLHQVVVKYNG